MLWSKLKKIDWQQLLKNLLLKFLLFFLAIFIATALTEVFLPIFTKTPENLAKLKSSNLFIHENKSNAQFDYDIGVGFDKVHIVMNSYGFRDDEFKIQKDPGVFRIAVLGDSFEEALQVKLSNTWQKVMATKLTDTLGKQVEVYNFGVSGYGTDQEWLNLGEKVWQFNPDMVVLAFTPNDVGDVYKNKLVKEDNGTIKFVSPENRLGGNFLGRAARHVYLYYYLRSFSQKTAFSNRVFNKIRVSVLGFAKDERFFLSDAQLVNGPFDVIASQKNSPKEVTDSWKVVELLIIDMAKQSSEHTVKFLIVINIPGYQVYNNEWESLKKQYNISGDSLSNQMNLDLAAIAKRHNITLYDPRDDASFLAGTNDRMHLQPEGHYNVSGHKFIGEKITEFIIKNQLIE